VVSEIDWAGGKMAFLSAVVGSKDGLKPFSHHGEDRGAPGVPERKDLRISRTGGLKIGPIGGTGDWPFIRGDANADGRSDLSDAVALLGYLFLGGANVPCDQAADADDSGDLN